MNINMNYFLILPKLPDHPVDAKHLTQLDDKSALLSEDVRIIFTEAEELTSDEWQELAIKAAEVMNGSIQSSPSKRVPEPMGHDGA